MLTMVLTALRLLSIGPLDVVFVAYGLGQTVQLLGLTRPYGQIGLAANRMVMVGWAGIIQFASGLGKNF
jgi:hypothetical protein